MVYDNSTRDLKVSIYDYSRDKHKYNNDNINETVKDDRNCWSTPNKLFNILHEHYKFTVDACANQYNNKLDYYWTAEQDALKQDWNNHVVFCNPPYSLVKPFVIKAVESNCTTVLLIPYRHRTNYFREYIHPYAKQIILLNPSPKFIDINGNDTRRAPFDLCIVVFDKYKTPDTKQIVLADTVLTQ